MKRFFAAALSVGLVLSWEFPAWAQKAENWDAAVVQVSARQAGWRKISLAHPADIRVEFECSSSNKAQNDIGSVRIGAVDLVQYEGTLTLEGGADFQGGYEFVASGSNLVLRKSDQKSGGFVVGSLWPEAACSATGQAESVVQPLQGVKISIQAEIGACHASNVHGMPIAYCDAYQAVAFKNTITGQAVVLKADVGIITEPD